MLIFHRLQLYLKHTVKTYKKRDYCCSVGDRIIAGHKLFCHRCHWLICDQSSINLVNNIKQAKLINLKLSINKLYIVSHLSKETSYMSLSQSRRQIVINTFVNKYLMSYLQVDLLKLMSVYILRHKDPALVLHVDLYKVNVKNL